jgi:phosphoenolpyruvate---glycerone phosphotransferase subunit DhaL
MMDAARQKQLILAVADAVIAHAEELTALDQAIGDGDHGVNMKRGFEVVRADADSLASKPLPDMLKALGMHLVMKVGGASGPLFGTLFMALGKDMPADPSLAQAGVALGQAIEAVKARGKSNVGQKTMLDVLAPLHAEFAHADSGDFGARFKRAAAEAAQATVPMKAIRGRASYLGDRSIGHMDPGARSVWLIADAICDALAAPTPKEEKS